MQQGHGPQAPPRVSSKVARRLAAFVRGLKPLCRPRASVFVLWLWFIDTFVMDVIIGLLREYLHLCLHRAPV